MEIPPYLDKFECFGKKLSEETSGNHKASGKIDASGKTDASVATEISGLSIEETVISPKFTASSGMEDTIEGQDEGTPNPLLTSFCPFKANTRSRSNLSIRACILSSYFSIRERSHLISLLRIIHRGHEDPRETEGAIEEMDQYHPPKKKAVLNPNYGHILAFY
ncbi:9879_t:CDS:2 [Paraglomus brasilianum]|uniref:9879_t:CDS:1 n=1 Tax=Paraglomus brasilianum TaxID=144538 RepID=A0A9N8ZNM7_9GLOM|nr:9879_t:CDS:2 [Paraglomus brasilianum]